MVCNLLSVCPTAASVINDKNRFFLEIFISILYATWQYHSLTHDKHIVYHSFVLTFLSLYVLETVQDVWKERFRMQSYNTYYTAPNAEITKKKNESDERFSSVESNYMARKGEDCWKNKQKMTKKEYSWWYKAKAKLVYRFECVCVCVYIFLFTVR